MWQVRQTSLEVSLKRIRQNFTEQYQWLQKKTAKQSEILVVLKSDAYGHSHQEVAACLDRLPPSAHLHGFGVANVEEGIALRREKITRPIYVLSGIQKANDDLIRCLATCKLTPVISSIEVLREFASRKMEKAIPLHLKFNTGMNRLGLEPEEADEAIKILRSCKNSLVLSGLMSHYSSSDKPESTLTKRQTRKFREIVQQFSQAGFNPKYLHMENSDGLKKSTFPEGNLVRLGRELYDSASTWKAQVYQIREVRKGEAIGYGPLYKAKKNMRMAVLGVGYADGYPRVLSNKADVLIHGTRCRVVGAVSMDLITVDVSKVKKISRNSEAVLLGRDGREEITAEELGKLAGTISYEIYCGISPRVPRVFKD